MPRKYAPRRRVPHRKGYGRKRNYARRKGPSVAIIRSPSAMPDVLKVKLRYSTQVPLTTPAFGGVGSHVFTANDLRDPDHTGTGHQPMGFDQWSAFYTKFLVRGCSIRTTWQNQSTQPQSINILAKAVNTVTTDFDTIRERGYGRSSMLQAAASGGANRTLKMYQSTARMVGIKPSKFGTDDNDYTGTTTVSPNIEWYYHLNAQTVDKTTSSTMQVIVELKFYVTFFKRVPLQQS